MKKSLAIVLILTMLCTSFAYANPVEKADEGFTKNSTPPNEIGITRMLMNKGVINKDSTPEAIEKAVQNYIQNKLVKNQPKPADKKVLLKELKRNSVGDIEYGNILHGKKLGKRITDIESVEEKAWSGSVRKAKMLILLAEFGEDEYDIGPLHNQIEMPAPDNDTDLWVDDFGREHYQKMLFTKGGYDAVNHRGETVHLDSMVDYYLEQSGGSYKVEGDVYGWYQLPHSEAYYGDDDEARGGHDNKLPGTSKDLVKDLLVVAQREGVPFEDYDIEDPYDMDGDGDFDEADGIIDHLVIVHAGVDQSGGGGAQGDNAIWAHSSSVFEYIPSDNPTVPYWDGNMLAYNYIIQGEDGGIGVFCHEFGHDIGLPDEYDTIYSGDGDPVGFYSLMSSGSWTGKPLGTKPAPMSPWARWTLGQIWGGQWVQPTEINYEDITKDGMTFKLDQTTSVGNNHQVLKVNLPKKLKVMTSPYEGSYEWYGGKGDEIDNTVAAAVYLPEASEIMLDFQTWYNIEEDWDFGFVQVSTDEGETWTSLSSGRTTDTIVPDGYPAIKDNMPGYTGSSNGWVNEKIDLTQYAGQEIMLQFRYMTDWGTSLEGFFIDDIKVIADDEIIFEDNAENGEDKWINHGWEISKGYEEKSHYYLLEWRNHNKTDESLTFGYNWNGDVAEFFKHDPGMLLWYRDTSYDDNWVGVHPGHGFLGIVDAHPQPMVEKGTTLRTRIQIHDAAFSLDRSEDKELTFFGKTQVIQGKQAVPEYNDAHSYWNNKAPSSGIKVPTYGLRFKVIGNSPDYTVGEIVIYK
ncbi:MAG: immune inhibitor A domain-containing protein [Bacillota bacterium]